MAQCVDCGRHYDRGYECPFCKKNKAVALYPIGETSTNELSYGRSGTESTCSMKCPNCMQVLVQTISKRGEHRWTVDAPGVQMECRCCGYGWFVEKYRVTLRRYK